MKYALLTGLLIGTICGFLFPVTSFIKKEKTSAHQVITPQWPDETYPINPQHEEEEEMIDPIETMPRFPNPACEALETEEDQRSCAEKEMLKFIYEHLEYPQEAREQGIEGYVVIQFIVSKEGKIINPTIVRDLGGNCGKRAMEIVKKMPDWIPGTQAGRVIRVLFNLPIRFELE
ncbi:MAG: energy transducer TonB [Bacteroidota bacterium]